MARTGPPERCTGRRPRWLLPAVLLLLLPAQAALAASVVVVRSRASAKAARLYQQAIEGLEATGPAGQEVLVMGGELAEPEALIAALRRHRPQVVVAIGPLAAKVLRAHIDDLPLVLCMVSQTMQRSLGGPNTTGVTMQPSPGKQLDAFRRVVPGLRRVGVIFHPELSGTFVARARAAAKPLGLTLVARSIESQRDVAEALRALQQRIDGLWILRDGKVVTPEFFNQSLMLQAERNLPLMVFSARFVAKGALCAYSASYRAQGRRAGRVVKSLLAGNPVAEVSLQAPDGTLTINIATAAKIGLELPAALLDSPDVHKVGG